MIRLYAGPLDPNMFKFQTIEFRKLILVQLITVGQSAMRCAVYVNVMFKLIQIINFLVCLILVSIFVCHYIIIT